MGKLCPGSERVIQIIAWPSLDLFYITFVHVKVKVDFNESLQLILLNEYMCQFQYTDLKTQNENKQRKVKGKEKET